VHPRKNKISKFLLLRFCREPSILYIYFFFFFKLFSMITLNYLITQTLLVQIHQHSRFWWWIFQYYDFLVYAGIAVFLVCTYWYYGIAFHTGSNTTKLVFNFNTVNTTGGFTRHGVVPYGIIWSITYCIRRVGIRIWKKGSLYRLHCRTLLKCYEKKSKYFKTLYLTHYAWNKEIE